MFNIFKNKRIKELEELIGKLNNEISGWKSGYTVLDEYDTGYKARIIQLEADLGRLEEKREFLANKVLVAEKGLQHAAGAVSRLKGRNDELYSKCETYTKRSRDLNLELEKRISDLKNPPIYEFDRGTANGLMVAQSIVDDNLPVMVLKRMVKSYSEASSSETLTKEHIVGGVKKKNFYSKIKSLLDNF